MADQAVEVAKEKAIVRAVAVVPMAALVLVVENITNPRGMVTITERDPRMADKLKYYFAFGSLIVERVYVISPVTTRSPVLNYKKPC